MNRKYYLWLASRGSRTQLPIMPPSVAPNAFIPKSDAGRQRRPLLLLLQPLRECMQSGLEPGRGQSGDPPCSQTKPESRSRSRSRMRMFGMIILCDICVFATCEKKTKIRHANKFPKSFKNWSYSGSLDH